MNGGATVGLFRNIGRFFGHVIAGAQHDPAIGERREVRRTVEEESREDGVTLRRTVIEEIRYPATEAAPDHAPEPDGTQASDTDSTTNDPPRE